ncbi:2504_t:CDS:2, partial [Acaulospora morrowiae]
MKVALKCLYDSQNISYEFLNEMRYFHNFSGNSSFIARCYGITRCDKTGNFIMVFELVSS